MSYIFAWIYLIYFYISCCADFRSSSSSTKDLNASKSSLRRKRFEISYNLLAGNSCMLMKVERLLSTSCGLICYNCSSFYSSLIRLTLGSFTLIFLRSERSEIAVSGWTRFLSLTSSYLNVIISSFISSTPRFMRLPTNFVVFFLS